LILPFPLGISHFFNYSIYRLCFYTLSIIAHNNYLEKIEGLNRFRTATLPEDIRYAEAFVLLEKGCPDSLPLEILKMAMIDFSVSDTKPPAWSHLTEKGILSRLVRKFRGRLA
jgi:hypothetical protein